MTVHIRKIIIQPLLSEKNSILKDSYNRYCFIVDPKANKIQIRKAVEQIFNVKVKKVNTISCLGKPKNLGIFRGRRAHWKKAFITLHEGNRIEFIEA